MEKEQQRRAKDHLVALIQAGHAWQEAAARAGVPISRSAAYRLVQKVRTAGVSTWQDGRHGHPTKLREPMLQWLKDYCQAAPNTPSHVVQQALEQRYGVRVSISHLNATRAALGLGSRTRPCRGKNWMPLREVNPTFKKEQADSCCSQQPKKRVCSPA